MTPILYPASTTNWANNGLGHLRDCIYCKVTEERNGIYELEMQYPLAGAHYAEIVEDCILKVKDSGAALQAFRVYKTGKPINGIVTFHARHISYDLEGIPVTKLEIVSSTAATALETLLARALAPHGFQGWSNVETISSTSFTRPGSIRSILGGQQGSILQNWGGEYEFDNYTVRLWEARGKKTEVVIEYGKNLMDAKQEKNSESTYTHVLPYAVQTSGQIETVYYLSDDDAEKLIQLAASPLGHIKVLSLDLSDKFGDGTTATPEALAQKAQAWIQANRPETPSVNITVSFVDLAQTMNYETIAPMQQLRLCDSVTVRFAKLGINATAKVIKTTYDVLSEKYTSIEIGDAKSNFAQTIIEQQQSVESIGREVKSSLSQTQGMIGEQTDLITGHNGGYFVIDPAVQPYRTLWMDTPDMATAQNVLQINGNGIGFSKTGVGGPYISAWTLDGKFNADFITTGTLTANVIRAGVMQSKNGSFSVDMDSGMAVLQNANITGGTISIGTGSGNESVTIDQGGIRLIDMYGTKRLDFDIWYVLGEVAKTNEAHITTYGVDMCLTYQYDDGSSTMLARIKPDGIYASGNMYLNGKRVLTEGDL
jgi:phage minor structural protein